MNYTLMKPIGEYNVIRYDIFVQCFVRSSQCLQLIQIFFISLTLGTKKIKMKSRISALYHPIIRLIRRNSAQSCIRTFIKLYSLPTCSKVPVICSSQSQQKMKTSTNNKSNDETFDEEKEAEKRRERIKRSTKYGAVVMMGMTAGGMLTAFIRYGEPFDLYSIQ